MGGLSSPFFSLQLSSLQTLSLLETVSGRISSTLKTTPVVLGLNQPIVSVLMALALHQAQLQGMDHQHVFAQMELDLLPIDRRFWQHFLVRKYFHKHIYPVHPPWSYFYFLVIIMTFCPKKS